MIQNFDVDTINEEMLEHASVYTTSNNRLTVGERAWSDCRMYIGSAAGLLGWAEAMLAVFAINKDVLPLKADLARDEAQLDVAAAELDEAERKRARLETPSQDALASQVAAVFQLQSFAATGHVRDFSSTRALKRQATSCNRALVRFATELLATRYQTNPRASQRLKAALVACGLVEMCGAHLCGLHATDCLLSDHERATNDTLAVLYAFMAHFPEHTPRCGICDTVFCHTALVDVAGTMEDLGIAPPEVHGAEDHAAPVQVIVRTTHEHFDKSVCGHKYCQACLKSWIGSNLSDRSVVIRCPEPECDSVLYADDIERLAGAGAHATFVKLKSTDHRERLVSSKMRAPWNRLPCKQCRCPRPCLRTWERRCRAGFRVGVPGAGAPGGFAARIALEAPC